MGFLSIVAYILMAVGGLGSIAGSVWFLIVAFRESVLWGVGCLLCGPVALFFLIKFWHDAWKPWVLQLAGTAVVIAGFMLLGLTAPPAASAFNDFSDEPYAEDYAEQDYSDDYGDAYGDATADDAAIGDAVDVDGDTAESSTDSTANPSGLDDDPVLEDPVLEDNLPQSPLGNSARSGNRSLAPPPTRLSGTVNRGSDDLSIDIDYAEEYIGKRLKLTKTNGKVVYCRLVEVTDEALIIQQPLGGGHVNFTIVKSSIANLAKDDR